MENMEDVIFGKKELERVVIEKVILSKICPQALIIIGDGNKKHAEIFVKKALNYLDSMRKNNCTEIKLLITSTNPQEIWEISDEIIRVNNWIEILLKVPTQTQKVEDFNRICAIKEEIESHQWKYVVIIKDNGSKLKTYYLNAYLKLTTSAFIEFL